jgi:predicted DNA-binding transcriptional regulator AlpA
MKLQLDLDQSDLQAIADIVLARLKPSFAILNQSIIHQLAADNATRANQVDSKVATDIANIREVAAMVGLSRATIYRLEKLGTFPKRRRLSHNRVCWLRGEVESWKTRMVLVSHEK